MIRPRLEYAGMVWSPLKNKCVCKLERLQRMTTKIVLELGGMTYEEKLRALDLPTLEEKREGDLIQEYKLRNGMNVVDNEEMLVRDEVRRCHKKMSRMGRCFKTLIEKSKYLTVMADFNCKELV